MSIDAMNAARGYGELARTLRPEAPATEGGLAAGAEAFAAAMDRADEATRGFAAGDATAQAVVEAIAQAEMALQTAVTVRDRIVGAYQEVLRMPL